MKPKENKKGDITKVAGYDACQTPAYALKPLLHYLPIESVVWESACGKYMLAAELLMQCTEVVATDLLYGYNFFEKDPGRWDIQVTNPPYSIKFQWLERSYELGRPFALLMPVEMLGTKTAQKLFKQHGIEVIFMSPRVDFYMPNVGWEGKGAQFPTAWYTWGLNIGQQMTFVDISQDKKNEIQRRKANGDLCARLGESAEVNPEQGRPESGAVVNHGNADPISTIASSDQITVDSISVYRERVLETVGEDGDGYFGA